MASREGGSDAAAACPVDHKTRELWLQQAKDQRPPHPPTTTAPPISSLPAKESCDSAQMDQSLQSPPTARRHRGLAVDREVSTIPRAVSSTTEGATPSNNEKEGGTSSSGHWIYPSEQMFFDAMRRKNYDPQAQDMKSIIPIHNAVNERAWREILKWESGRGGQACGGPRLVSFSGDSSKLTPKARINTMLGYTAPFDRHDWVVDRCGTKVDYVIDFYSGKDDGGKSGKSLSFYLDVRPKLNTWEGVKMRFLHEFGF